MVLQEGIFCSAKTGLPHAAAQRPTRKTGALTQQAKPLRLRDWLSGQTSLKSIRLRLSQDGDALNAEGAWVLELHPGTS